MILERYCERGISVRVLIQTFYMQEWFGRQTEQPFPRSIKAVRSNRTQPQIWKKYLKIKLPATVTPA